MHKNSLLNASQDHSNDKRYQQSQQSKHSKNNIEQLIYRLCSKIASVNNLNDKLREDFINKSYAYLVKLFCSDAYTQTYDAFDLSQKIKKHCKCQKIKFYCLFLYFFV
jgi:hypothetical protein